MIKESKTPIHGYLPVKKICKYILGSAQCFKDILRMAPYCLVDWNGACNFTLCTKYWGTFAFRGLSASLSFSPALFTIHDLGGFPHPPHPHTHTELCSKKQCRKPIALNLLNLGCPVCEEEGWQSCQSAGVIIWRLCVQYLP